jgi:UDP-2,4-diacetamido-2,4,6-trideoxy-beta-L-altropyranose hydrolase
MRCLTLAMALRDSGEDVVFITRAHEGNLDERIVAQGFKVYSLAKVDSVSSNQPRVAYEQWLGIDQLTDAEETIGLLGPINPAWLIVDHYSLDQLWEKKLADFVAKIMVIDDLCERTHHCSLLLDQNLGRKKDDYSLKVPETCKVLIGPKYSLLRPEFLALRDRSLSRRSDPEVKHLLVTMGGVDQSNATGKILQELKRCHLPNDCHLTVVMGANAPWLADVCEFALSMPWQMTVEVDVNNMAELMIESDLIIGAAGTTSWERCCLGVPTIIVVLAENQLAIAEALINSGAAISPGDIASDVFGDNLRCLVSLFVQEPEKLADMSKAAAEVVDGGGVSRVIESMRLNN